MNQPVRIPFADLVTPHLEMRDELVSVIEEAVRTEGFVGIPTVKD